jgi:hypothetical protein
MRQCDHELDEHGTALAEVAHPPTTIQCRTGVDCR